jgi:hypothetical protein
MPDINPSIQTGSAECRGLVAGQPRHQLVESPFKQNPTKTWHYIFAPAPLDLSKINGLLTRAGAK